MFPLACFTTERHPEFDGQCFTGKIASYVWPLWIKAFISKAEQNKLVGLSTQYSFLIQVFTVYFQQIINHLGSPVDRNEQ